MPTGASAPRSPKVIVPIVRVETRRPERPSWRYSTAFLVVVGRRSAPRLGAFQGTEWSAWRSRGAAAQAGLPGQGAVRPSVRAERSRDARGFRARAHVGQAAS